MRVYAFLLSLFALSCAMVSSGYAATPVEVMVVGTYHMSNPNRDMHDVQSDNVLAPKRQAEIIRIVDGLARFRPTVVDVEWPRDLTEKRYHAYLTDKLPPSHNEVVQLGFRLAKRVRLARVYGIDVDGDFPYAPVEAYAKVHGELPLLKKADAEIVTQVTKLDDILVHGTIADVLRSINDPASISNDNSFYRTTLKIGDRKNQPGAELLAAWYKRNFYICAHLLQTAFPGDRVAVFYGYGHLFLLRQCVAETPGFRLIEATAYLPR